MDESVLAAVLGRNEAESLGGLKEFYGAGNHGKSLSSRAPALRPESIIAARHMKGRDKRSQKQGVTKTGRTGIR
jgi:hypothetical protein